MSLFLSMWAVSLQISNKLSLYQIGMFSWLIWVVLFGCQPLAGSRVVRIDPLHFLAGCRTRRLNQVYILSYILACFIVLLFIRAPFLYIVSLRCYVLCLLVVLVELSVLAKWLARKTPLRKPNRGEGIISRKSTPKSAHDFLGLLYCFIVLLCIYIFSSPYVIYYHTVMARYGLFVLKVSLNPSKQTYELSWVLLIRWSVN